MTEVSGRQRQVRLFYDPEYITFGLGDLFAMGAYGLPLEGVKGMKEEQKKLLDYARSIGITVIESDNAVAHDGPNDYVTGGPSLSSEEEKAELHRIDPTIQIPETVSFEEFDAAPFFPVLAKRRGVDLGKDKFLLETPEHWTRLSMVLRGDKPLRRASKAMWEQNPKKADNYERPLLDQPSTRIMEYQRFINTPSKHFTSFRALISASGFLLASSLNYSASTKDKTPVPKVDTPIDRLGLVGTSILDFLKHPESLAFLGTRSVLSNRWQGGKGIVLNPVPASKPHTKKEAAILEAHGIDPEYPKLPEVIAQQSRTIGRTIGRRRDFILGIDWLQEVDTENYYMIDLNAGPAPGTYADAHLRGKMGDDVTDAWWAMRRAGLRSLL